MMASGMGSVAWLQRAAQHVVRAAFGAALALAIKDVHGICGLLDADVGAKPAARFERWIDEFEPRLRFVPGHLAG